jgi:uncharacterized protein
MRYARGEGGGNKGGLFGCRPRGDEPILGGRRAQGLASGHRLLADDVVLHFPGRSPFSGDFVGKEAFLERYDRLREVLGGTIELAEVREVLMGSVRVVALVTERAVRGERNLEFERVNVYSWAGSEITEIRTYDYDPSALEEFWS